MSRSSSSNRAAGEREPAWLWRIEMFGTTLVVLLIGSMMLWSEALVRAGV